MAGQLNEYVVEQLDEITSARIGSNILNGTFVPDDWNPGGRFQEDLDSWGGRITWEDVGAIAADFAASNSDEDAERLLACVRKNRGLVYAMFETSVFHDDLYAMEKLYAADVFGHIIYSEGEYCHPHSLGEPPLASYKDWRKNGAPMWYPTHATAYYIGVTHGSFVEVSCQGTAPFDKSKRQPNAIGNIFNSEVGLFRTREGGVCRIIICGSQGEYLEAGRLRGEHAGYSWHNGLAAGFVGDAEGKKRLKEAMAKGVQTKKPALPPGVSAGGHGGSHGYLANDFIDAILRGRKPAVDVIDALNMTVPGYYAHLSATKDGENLKIPQYSL